MKRVLITGITGYIGSQLARALLPEHEVYGLVREPVNRTYLPQELFDTLVLLPYDGTADSMGMALEKCRPDTVFHLAAHYTGGCSLRDTEKIVCSCLDLGAYLLAAMDCFGCRRLIYATSITSFDSAGKYRPQTLYAASKNAFSCLVDYYTQSKGLCAASMAMSDTYGAGDRRPKVLNLIRNAIQSETPIDLSPGSQIYDVIYIDDVIHAFLLAAKSLPSEPSDSPEIRHRFYQLHNPDALSLRETVDLMLRVNGLTLRANWGARPMGENMPQPMPAFSPPPGWKPEVPPADALKLFWDEQE